MQGAADGKDPPVRTFKIGVSSPSTQDFRHKLTLRVAATSDFHRSAVS